MQRYWDDHVIMTPQGLSIILPTMALPWFGHLRNGDIGGLPDFCLIVRTKRKMLIFCIVLIFALTFVTFDRCMLYR